MLRMTLLLATVVSIVSSFNAKAESYVYSGSYGGAWDNASNWTPTGVPGSSDSASIGAYQSVNVNGNTTIGTLTINHSQVNVGPSYTLTVSTAASVTDSDISSFVINSGATLTSNASYQNNAYNITNNGTVTVASGTLVFSYSTNTGTLATSGTGKLAVADYSTLNFSGSLTGVMDCRGSLALTGVPTCSGTLNLLSSGSIDGTTAGLSLTGTMTMRDSSRTNAPLYVASSATLSIANGYSIMIGGTVTLAGTMNITDVNVNGFASVNIVPGGAMNGITTGFTPAGIYVPVSNSGTVKALSGTFEAYYLTNNSDGTLDSSAGAMIKIGSYQTLNNAGTIAGVVEMSNGTLNNTGVGTCSGTLSLSSTQINGSGSLSVSGTLNISGFPFVSSALNIGPTGTLSVQPYGNVFMGSSLTCSGTIQLNDGSIGTGNGSISINSGGVVLANGTYNGCELSGNFTNNGTLRCGSGELRLRDGLTGSSGVLATTGSGTLKVPSYNTHSFSGSITGTMLTDGTLNLTGIGACSGTLSLTGSSPVTGFGSLNVTGSMSSSGFNNISGAVNIAPGATWSLSQYNNMNINSAVTCSGSISLNNATIGTSYGSLAINSGGIVVANATYNGCELYGNFTNSGTLRCDSGELRLRDGATTSSGVLATTGAGSIKIASYNTHSFAGSITGTVQAEGSLNLTGIATCNGTLSLTGSSPITGFGSLNVTGSVSSSGFNTISGAVNIAPFATWSLAQYNNVNVNSAVTCSGTINLNNATLGTSYGSIAINSGGTLVGTGLGFQSSEIYGNFTNSGTIRADGTELRLRDGLTASGGVLATTNGGSLRIPQYNTHSFGGSMTGLMQAEGTLAVTGNASCSGTLGFSSQINGSGSLSVSGSLYAIGFSPTISVPVSIGPAGLLNVTNSSLAVNSSMTSSGSIVLSSAGTSAAINSFSSGWLMIVQGTLTSSGSSANTLNLPVSNAGTITSTNGELGIYSVTNSGTLTSSGTGTLRVPMFCTLSDSGTISGTLNMDGTLSLSSISNACNGTINLRGTVNGQQMNVNGTLNLYDTVSNLNTAIAVAPGATLVSKPFSNAFANQPIFNLGTISIESGSISGFGSGSISNLSGGLIRTAVANTNGSIHVPVSSAGALTATNGTLSIDSFIQTAGTTTLAGGNLGNGTYSINGGLLTGAGSIGGTVSNAATVAPGNSGTGTLSINNFSQLSTGILQIELASGSNFDVLSATSASLGGSLQATPINGYSPAPHASLLILPSSNVSGTFANASVPSPLQVQYVAGTGVRLFAPNNAPVAVDDNVGCDEDVATLFSTLKANDIDADGDTLTITSVQTVSQQGGSVSLQNGNVAYTPPANFHGNDSFTYTITDPYNASSTATVNVTVASVNDAPAAVNDSAATNEDTALVITAVTLAANDTDVDGDTLTVTGVSATSAQGGSVALANGNVTYIPAANFNGADSFTYTVSDGNGKTATGTVNVNVAAVNDAPLAVNDNAATNEDTAVVVAAATLAANDTDVDGDTLTVTGVSATSAQGGSVALADGNATYTPAANFNGADSFTYTVSDGHGGTATGTVNVNVAAVNDAPIATNDSAATNEDTAVVIAAATLAANDADVDGDTITVTGVSATSAQGGSVVLADGNVTYTPAANFNGADSFTYTVSDGHGGTATGTVNVNVAAVNDAPVAVNDGAATNEDTAVVIAAATLAANDTDVDGDTLTVTGVSATSAQGGTAGLASGNVTYTPAANFNGADSFTYTVSDGHGGTATGTVNVNVATVNDAPVADGASLSTAEDVSLPITLSGSDVEGSALTFTIITQPVNGLLTGTPPNVTYTPNPNFNGNDSFTFRVNDGTANSAVATISIAVSPVNDLPVAQGQNIYTLRNTAVGVTLAATDVDGDGLTYHVIDSPAHGTITGTLPNITYTPASNYFGTDLFTFAANDGTGDSNVAIVNVLVNAPPSASITSPVAGTVLLAGATVSITATASDADGTVAKVEFFAGSTKLGEDTSSPYSFNWTNAPAGAYTLTAVATDNLGAVTTSAGVNIVVDVPPSVTLTSPTNGALFTPGSTIALAATASDSDGTVTKVEFYRGATLIGTDTTSPYTFNWTSVPAGSYAITARATDNNNIVTTSNVANIVVQNPPTVSITSPTNNTVFQAGANITINATASDSDGTVSKVEFFQGSTKLGEDLTSPYTFTWNNAPAGTYVLTAKATDNSGAVTTSTGVTIIVNAAPTVSITSPANGASFPRHANITITANAADTDGSITKVEFYRGTTLISTDTTAPYSATWNNAGSGTYALTAKAYDNQGAITTSTAVTITVQP